MRKALRYISSVILLMSLFISTASTQTVSPKSDTTSSSRTIILDGESLKAKEYAGFTTWGCKTYASDDGSIVVEVGIFGNPDAKEKGFILYNGENYGEYAEYKRQGLDSRWNWDLNDKHSYNYSLIMESDGTSYYLDLTNDSATVSETFKCTKTK